MFTANQLILGKTLREHIGGRWAISLLAFVINAPINMASIFTNASASQGQEVSARWWIVAVVGYLTFGAVLWLASSTLFRNRRVSPVPIWWVVALGFIAGGIRGLTVGLLAQQMGLASVDPTVVFTRFATGAFMGSILLPIAALVLSIIFTYRHERAWLLEERVESERTLLQTSGVSETLRSALLESVQSDLSQIRTSSQARELSHRLWEKESSYTPPKLSLWPIIRTSVTRNPYASMVIIPFWSITAFGSLAVAIGSVRAVLQILFSATAIAVTFWIGRKLNKINEIPGFLSFAFVMGLTVLLTSFIASWIFDPRPWPAGAGLVLSNAVWLPLLTILFGIVVTAIRSSESVIDELKVELTKTELTQAAIDRENEELRKEIAAKLHGSVQSRLLITAALLDNGDFNRVAPLVDPEMSTTVLESLESEQGVSARESIEAMAKSWSGLMTVELDLCPDSKLDSHAIAVTRIVEEGLSNAFRHGKATHVSVHLTKSEGSLEVVIADNGVGVSGVIEKGLGLTLIESFNPVEYSLEPNSPQGSILFLKLLTQS